MPVYRSSKGKYFVKFRKNGMQYFKRFASLAEAREWESLILNQLNENQIAIAIPTFKKLFDIWFENWKTSVEESTCNTNGRKYIRYLFQFFPQKNKLINQLNYQDFLQWWNKLDKIDISARSKNHFLSMFKKLCQFSSNVYQIGIPHVFILPHFKDHHPRKRKEHVIYTSDQVFLFLSVIQYKEIYFFYLVSFFTGLRPGETRCLHVGDFDQENGSLFVGHAITDETNDGKAKEKSTKTGESRYAFMPEFVAIALNSYVEELPYRKDKTAYLFPSPRYGSHYPISENTLNREKNKACQMVGLPQIDNYEFRHSYATYSSILGNGNLNAVASQLGHKSIQTTYKYYDHSRSEQARGLAKEINDELIKEGKIESKKAKIR